MHNALVIHPFFLQFDNLFSQIVNAAEFKKRHAYPPTDFLKTGENTYELQMALAGFKQDQINITQEDTVISIKGAPDALPEGVTPMAQGIARRGFSYRVNLNHEFEVSGVTFENGILSIKIALVIPESKKPKIINIG